jgi:hypothetical protein
MPKVTARLKIARNVVTIMKLFWYFMQARAVMMLAKFPGVPNIV